MMIRTIICTIVMLVVLAQVNTQSNQLIVLPKPYEDNKVKAVIGESFFLSCFSYGPGATKALQWLLPTGQVAPSNFASPIYTIHDNGQLTLQFEKLDSHHAGEYTCLGVNNGRNEQVRIELLLEKRISFENTPLNQFIRADSEPQLIKCNASSIPGPEIAWYRNDVTVKLDNGAKYAIKNDGLEIRNVQVEDEDVYLCQASVVATGEIKRAAIKVQVIHKPVWHVKPVDTDGVNGQDVVIRCKATAKPAPTYSWYKNGIRLAGDRYVFTADSLRILQSVVDDRGTYTCEAQNESGKISANFRVNILVGPQIVPMEQVNVLEGQEAVIKCVVREAFPKAEIKWKYADTMELVTQLNDDKVQIDFDTNEQGDNLVGSWSYLRIKAVDRMYNRNFTCVAENKASVSERQVRLVVEYVPTLLINSESREVYYSWLNVDQTGSSGSSSSHVGRGAGTLMTCIAAGEPKPQITWFFNSEQINHDNVKFILHKDELGLSQLEVVPERETDFGSYQCKADNRVGSTFRNIELRMATSPKLAPLFVMQNTRPESVNFKVSLSQEPTSNGGLPIHTVKVQWKFINADWSSHNEKNFPVNNQDHMFVDILALLPDTEYLFRVAGINRVGQGQWSKQIKIKTLSRRQPEPIRVLSKEDCSSSTRCYIEWTIDSNGGSPIRDYLIKWRRLSYKDSSNKHVDPRKLGAWSDVVVIKAPITNYEITNILPNSFYEVDVLARNDIGPSASQPFRIRTLPGQIEELEAFRKPNESVINRVILICGSVIAAIILFIIIDVLLLMKFDCGFLAILTKSCAQQKDIPIDFKPTHGKIVQHSTKTNNPYMPINQNEELLAGHVSIPLKLDQNV